VNSDEMRQVQLKQVTTLAEQMTLPGEKGTHAAVCLAHLVKPGSSQVALEALNTLLETLQQANSLLARRRAAWVLAKIAAAVNSSDLSDRIVPVMIHALILDEPLTLDVRLARQVYLSLRQIGTPDALAAIDTYHTALIDSKVRKNNLSAP